MRRYGLFIKKLFISISVFVCAIGGYAQAEAQLLKYNYIFLEAIKQYQLNNLSGAFELLHYAQEINPQAPEVHYELAGYYYNLEDFKQALYHFEKAMELNPNNATYVEKVGQYYVTQKDYDKALPIYEKLYAITESRIDVIDILYRLYGVKENYKKMLEMLERMEMLQGKSESTSLLKMDIYEEMGDKKKEYAELLSWVNQNAYDLNYKVLLGNWLLKNKREKEAYKKFKEVLKEEPDNTFAKFSLLDYYDAINDTKAAEELREDMLQSPKTDKETKLSLLKQVIANNREKEDKGKTKVLKLFNKVLAEPQQDADLTMLKAAFLSALEEPDTIINQLYRDAIAIEPDHKSATLLLIISLWDKEKYEEVAQTAKNAIEYDPEEVIYYYYLGVARFNQHKNDEAIDILKKGVAQAKANTNTSFVSDMYAIMGDLLHAKGLNQEAFEAYDSCLHWRAENLPALNNYSYYLSLTKKQLKKAEQMSYKTIKAEPKNTTYLDTYAWILFIQERFEEAKIYIDEALKNDSTFSGTIIEHAGDIYFKAGYRDKAIEFWKQSLEKGNSSATLKRKIELQQYIEDEAL